MKTLPYRPPTIDSPSRMRPYAALICPACNSEIGLTELIEKKGYVGCVNCVE